MVSNIRAKKFEVIDIIRMMNSKVSTKTRTKEIYNFQKSITLKNVDFSYDKNNEILKKINLTINKGDKVGIIGSTGSGKSTLLDIIMGLLKPTKGEIIVDEENIISSTKNIQMHKWRSCISHVPQNIFIADASFAENIAFGLYKDQIDMEKVIECSRKAMIEDLILKSEKKYNTNLGEGGVKLSGGQKQRIGIARALYKNSQVLVLDEATSALDNKTEKDVMKTIKNLHEITILIVTHRPSTIKYCDKIIEIDKGCIVSQ
jgi:ATP-binding cassette subfamily B protein